jgi:phosphoribosylformylglycinamidine synthase subunit PurQ / glutaminase
MATFPGNWHRSGALWRKLRPDVRRLRREPTEAEALLWEQLRKNRLGGARFRRPHPIGQFIVDFCCPSRRLIVELDGPIHDAQAERDAMRQSFLQERGYQVLRIPNDDVLLRMGEVLQRIGARLILK